MQKRRGRSSALPMTSADVSDAVNGKSSSRYKNQRPATRKKKRKGGLGCFGYSILFSVLIGGLYLGSRYLMPGDPSISSRRIEELDKSLPLSQYSSLEYALKHSNLVGLYFAAAWCPMSTPVTNMIDELLGEKLLPPPSPSQAPPTQRMDLSLVYVSSDHNEEAFENYHRQNWMSVPFESEDRTALKKHFSVCAHPEVRELGIDRKFEIPTLLILDGETHGVISTNGAEDIMEFKENALVHWLELKDLVRAMEEKYAGEGNGLIKPKNPRIHNGDSLSSLFA